MYYVERFPYSEKMVEFLNNYDIKKENIISIDYSDGITLIYYA